MPFSTLDRLSRGPAHKNTRLPLLVLALGAIASLVLFAFIKDSIEKEAELRFERQASDAKHAIAARIYSYAEVMYGLRSLYRSSYPVTRAAFHRYVTGLDLAHRYPGFWTFNYAQWIRHEEKANLEARVRKDTSLDPRGYPNFAVTPSGDRPEYYVLTYVEPMAENEPFFGLDISNNPAAINPRAVAEALANARDSGELTSSGQLLHITKGQERHTSLAMRLAVYRSDLPVKTVEQRRAAYIGSVGGAFFVKELMQGVMDERALQLMRFKLYEAGPAPKYAVATHPVSADRLLFDSRDLSRSAAAAGASGEESSFSVVLPIEVGGRMWEIHFSTPHEAAIAGVDRALPWLTLGGGLLISALLFAILYSLAAGAQRVEAARREAVAANIAKTKFLAAASHDLRQPMQALSMYASVLEDRVTDTGAVRVVRGIELSVRTLEQLFDSLLDISRIESGVIKPEITAFALMPLMERVVEAELPIAAQKHLEVRVVATSAHVRSDPVLLERMLKNLVTNAIRYTERGKIVVGCRRLRGGRLRLEVADSGIGIPADEQERIFDEYYQLGGKSAQGLGLGLPIVKSLGELLGHTVTVRSARGRGSVFAIELMQAAAAAPPATPPGPSLQHGLKGMTAVVVDDDAEIRDSVRLLLESWECRCVSGATASEVELELRKRRLTPDALIVDYRLADTMDGLQIIDHLREAFGAGLPALIITGTANLSLLQERAPGIRVAMKPVPPGKLRAFLSQSLRQRAISAGNIKVP